MLIWINKYILWDKIELSLPDGSVSKDATIFRVDMSSLGYVGNKGKMS